MQSLYCDRWPCVPRAWHAHNPCAKGVITHEHIFPGRQDLQLSFESRNMGHMAACRGSTFWACNHKALTFAHQLAAPSQARKFALLACAMTNLMGQVLGPDTCLQVPLHRGHWCCVHLCVVADSHMFRVHGMLTTLVQKGHSGTNTFFLIDRAYKSHLKTGTRDIWELVKAALSGLAATRLSLLPINLQLPHRLGS